MSGGELVSPWTTKSRHGLPRSAGQLPLSVSWWTPTRAHQLTGWLAGWEWCWVTDGPGARERRSARVELEEGRKQAGEGGAGGF